MQSLEHLEAGITDLDIQLSDIERQVPLCCVKKDEVESQNTTILKKRFGYLYSRYLALKSKKLRLFGEI